MKVALERIKEYSELETESPEFVEPRPPTSWPSKGDIVCEDLVIRYAVGGHYVLVPICLISRHQPDLPDVLHELNFSIQPGEKVSVSDKQRVPS
jgi:ABC-type multidrug transport system fused ATPase/permease subunit